MEKISKENLKLIMTLALEFRLSLKNICRFLKVESTDENQILYYDELIKNAGDVSKVEEFKYLVYETTNEPLKDSNIAYNLALLYYLKYVTAKNSGNSIDINFTDIEFKKIMARGFKSITERDAEIIAKFRIKHLFSKANFSNDFNINRNTLTRWEKMITNPRIIHKLDILNDYNHMLSMPYLKKASRGK